MLEHRSIVHRQQKITHMNTEIEIDSDQIGVEGRTMDLREREAVRDDGCRGVLIAVGDDVGGVEEWRRRSGARS